MKKKEAKENRFFNFLRVAALIEAVVVIILSVIAFSTKNAFLFKILFYVGIITAFFAMSLLFLKFTGIIEPNPIGDIPSALLLLAIFIAIVSGIPSVINLVNSQNIAIDSLNKSIESLEGLPNFMQAQTEAMNKSIVILEEIHDFLIKPVPE
ncbi:hypothetical protein ES708_28783 [subsurface metagenome]